MDAMDKTAKPQTAPAGPAPRRHATRFWVHYRMTDRMGVVYYGNYLELFEMARSAMIREAGWRYGEMEADGFMLPVVHAELDYLAPAFYEDELHIETQIAKLTGRSVEFAYEIRRNDEPRVICRGTTRHLIVGQDGRPRRLSDQWRARFEAMV